MNETARPDSPREETRTSIEPPAGISGAVTRNPDPESTTLSKVTADSFVTWSMVDFVEHASVATAATAIAPMNALRVRRSDFDTDLPPAATFSWLSDRLCITIRAEFHEQAGVYIVLNAPIPVAAIENQDRLLAPIWEQV